ncbi:glycosyltransferase family 2 protein, partial [Candidatus Margulisiibacteriota bacterium]
AKEIFSNQKLNGFGFDVEVLYLARKFGYRIKEVPVTWINSPSSKVNVLSDPLKMFADLFLIRLIHLFTRKNIKH